MGDVLRFTGEHRDGPLVREKEQARRIIEVALAGLAADGNIATDPMLQVAMAELKKRAMGSGVDIWADEAAHGGTPDAFSDNPCGALCNAVERGIQNQDLGYMDPDMVAQAVDAIRREYQKQQR